MTESEIRKDERREVRNIIGYFKRELAKNNPDRPKMDYLFDGLLSELEANWSLCDTHREMVARFGDDK